MALVGEEMFKEGGYLVAVFYYPGVGNREDRAKPSLTYTAGQKPTVTRCNWGNSQ